MQHINIGTAVAVLVKFIMGKPDQHIELYQTPEEFEVLFKQYFNPLTNFAYKYLHNLDDSREVVQETFAKVWNNRTNIKVHTSIQSYLFQATKNTVIDYVRKNKKYKKTEDDIELSEEAITDDSFKLKPYLIKQAILQAMDKLKPKNKEIFRLNKMEGLTYKEIAAHLDISERSVEDNISRALKILKKELENNENLF